MDPCGRCASVVRVLAVASAVAVARVGGCHDSPPRASAPPVVDMASIGRARHHVEVDGHRLAVHGKSSAQPRDVIVLVHGRTWSSVPDFDLQVSGEERSFMDALVGEGFATYAVDLRGYGGTPRDATGWLTPERASADLAAVVDWVGKRHPNLRKPVLLGWSYGSLVSQLAVQSEPGLVSDLILFGYPGDPGQVIPASPQPAGEPPRETNTAEAAASDFIRPDVISQVAIDTFVATSLAADPTRVDWTRLEQWNALDPARVRVPTLMIHGEYDPYAPLERGARVFAGLGHGDRAWVVVANGDHAAHLEDTRPRFLHAVVSFVRRPQRVGPP